MSARNPAWTKLAGEVCRDPTAIEAREKPMRKVSKPREVKVGNIMRSSEPGKRL